MNSTLKRYIGGWRFREHPENHVVDYSFESDPDKAAYWQTREEAERDCLIFENHNIVIPAVHGGSHVCSGFKVEECAPGRFVVYCMAPFIQRSRSGESAKS